jgi:multidrug efflux pump
LTSLPVQQYPQIESSSVVITTVYYGASAETVRGFLTTPIERAVSAISGVDYIESNSRAGVSTVTVRLKLDHSSTAALAEVTARLQQVRSELPPDAEPPPSKCSERIGRTPTFYLSFTSTQRDAPAVTDWLSRRSSRSWRRCRACSGSRSRAAASSPCVCGSIRIGWRR